jgi:hypothetical protein
MIDDPSTDDPVAFPPPAEGELLAGAAEAFGVRYKLETYSLDVNHKSGGPKAQGFERILGITIDDVDYLEAMILDGVQITPRLEGPWQPSSTPSANAMSWRCGDRSTRTRS